MRKIICCLLPAVCCLNASRAADWWLMPTICQPLNNECYKSMGSAGFEPNEWDTGGNCKGKKLVCPNAVADGSLSAPAPFSKAEISDSSVINEDFDTAALDTVNACWGVRKTKNNGTNAKVGSEWRNVYCNGVLEVSDETLSTGEIAIAAADQPTCKSLAASGHIGVLNGQCYGKAGYFESDFYLECEGDDLLPKKIAVLNGAMDYRTDTADSPRPSAYPTTEELANAMFEKMIENAAEQQRAAFAKPEEEEESKE